MTIAYEWSWAPGAETAYRAAHDLPDDEDLADVEFDSDEEAREAGFVPGWQIGRHLCTDPEQYGHANVYDTPGETPAESKRPPRTRPPRPRARPTSAAASGSGTPTGGPRPRSAPCTLRSC